MKIMFTTGEVAEETKGLREGWDDEVFTDAGIYFVRCAQFVKIGCAQHIDKRIREIALSVPFPTECLASIIMPRRFMRTRELELHRKFFRLRVRGEWFRLDEPLTGFIASLPKVRR